MNNKYKVKHGCNTGVSNTIVEASSEAEAKIIMEGRFFSKIHCNVISVVVATESDVLKYQ